MMKNKLALFPIFLSLSLGKITSAQYISEGKSFNGKELEFVEVRNGCIYEMKIPVENSDISAYLGISTLVFNSGSDEFRIDEHINDKLWINSSIYLKPGEIKSLEIILKRTFDRNKNDLRFMNGLPGGAVWHWDTADPTKIDKITFKIYTKGKATLSISEVKPFGQYTSSADISKSPGFFPFIDRLGQYKHTDWPGKIKSESELSQAAVDEEIILQLMPGPSDRNRFGSWASGPRLEATGNFRTEKVNGKWWLVDPEGRLYWSHGVTCIGSEASTRITGREPYFEDLPDSTGPFGLFYSKDRNGLTFNYLEANLYRKYGAAWKEKNSETVLKRLKSWGLNSFGNWSDPKIYLSSENRIPYTVGISPMWPRIDGGSGRFPNVFDSGFRQSVKIALRALDLRIREDPYCIGFFVDNELDIRNLTPKLVYQNANSTAKQAFVGFLKTRYISIKELNKSWKATISSWRQIANLSDLPEGAKEDIEFFDLYMIDIYYRTCFEEVKIIFPEKLYFGSRLHCHYFPDDQSESQIIKIAAQYCDVVCFNRYRFSAEDLILPFGIDKPTIIGEFHFGALDRGLCHTGLRSVANQQQRAESYYRYVEGALHNPQIVGTHWFQYPDQAFTGRGDGENYQIGFIDVCDNPYPEIINAAREIGYKMYKVRNGE